MSKLTVSVVLVIVPFLCSVVQEQTCVDPASLAESTVSIVRTFDEKERNARISRASGLRLSPKKIATLEHVANGMGLSKVAWTKVVLRQELGAHTNNWVEVHTFVRVKHIVHTGAHENIYILELSQPNGSVTAPRIRTTVPREKEPLVAVGYPGGKLRTGFGNFVRIGTFDKDGDYAGMSLVELSDGNDRRVFGRGASGGPAYDCQGYVVGLISRQILTFNAHLRIGLGNFELRLTTAPGEPNSALVSAATLKNIPLD